MRRAAWFRSMFERHYRCVLAYTSDADADDVVGETFLVAWRRLDDVPAADGELPWLVEVEREQGCVVRRGWLPGPVLHPRTPT